MNDQADNRGELAMSGPAIAGAGQSPFESAPPVGERQGPPKERPEILVGAAFVGGIALAQLLKRLGS